MFMSGSSSPSLDETLDHFVAQIVEPLCMIEDYIEVNDVIANMLDVIEEDNERRIGENIQEYPPLHPRTFIPTQSSYPSHSPSHPPPPSPSPSPRCPSHPRSHSPPSEYYRVIDIINSFPPSSTISSSSSIPPSLSFSSF